MNKLTVRDIMQKWGCTRAYVVALIASGKLKAEKKDGWKYTVDRKSFDTFDTMRTEIRKLRGKV